MGTSVAPVINRSGRRHELQRWDARLGIELAGRVDDWLNGVESARGQITAAKQHWHSIRPDTFAGCTREGALGVGIGRFTFSGWVFVARESGVVSVVKRERVVGEEKGGVRDGSLRRSRWSKVAMDAEGRDMYECMELLERRAWCVYQGQPGRW